MKSYLFLKVVLELVAAMESSQKSIDAHVQNYLCSVCLKRVAKSARCYRRTDIEKD
jgi:hypothetical protein